jgi:hypothetical protein
MTHTERFFASLDGTQPMTREQVREFERAARRDKQEQYGDSDRRLIAELLTGRG